MVRILFGVLFEWWVEKLAKPRERKRTHDDPNLHVLAHSACSVTQKRLFQWLDGTMLSALGMRWGTKRVPFGCTRRIDLHAPN